MLEKARERASDEAISSKTSKWVFTGDAGHYLENKGRKWRRF